MHPVKIVMMIDDDLEDQEIFRDALYSVDPSIECQQPSSATLALTLLVHENYRPDLIFLDLNMPRMNGFEFIEQFRKHEQLSMIPIVIYSTSTVNRDKEKAKSMGTAGFITKPANMKSLISILQDTLRSISNGDVIHTWK